MAGVDCRSQQTEEFQDNAMSGDEAVSVEDFQDLTLTSGDGGTLPSVTALHRNAAPLGAKPRSRSFLTGPKNSWLSNARPETVLPHPG